MAVSITDGIAQPDTTVALRVTGPGSAISGVTLWERVVDADGTPVAERAVPVALEVVSTRTWPWESEYRLLSADGGPLLRYNARYQLFAAAQLLDLTVAGLEASKVERSYEFATLDTPAPLLGPEPVRLEPGKAIPLRWSQPVERLDYEIWPPAQTTLRRDAADSRLWWLQLHDYVQGRDYEVRLAGAEAANGTTLEAPVAFKVSSPPGIAVESITPKDGAINISATTRLTVTFSAPIDEADRAAAQAAVTIEPPVRGTFVWEQPDQVVFVPAEKLPPSERMTLRVRGGADGVRAQNGGFLAGDVAATFTTRTNKRIDVDLSKQMLYLYEGDKLVFSTVTSTGATSGDVRPVPAASACRFPSPRECTSGRRSAPR